MDIRAKKSLGQNFLVNEGIVGKIISASLLGPEDTVLEIGPGRGVLTRALAEKAGRVIAIEKDHRLIEPLKERFRKVSNVEIVENDILVVNPNSYSLTPNSYKIVANIPYYITSHLLRVIFETAGWRMTPPSLIVLLVQKEVAQRICAKPGDLSLLGLSVQYYARPEIVAPVSKGSFRPIPKVDSAILRLNPIPPALDFTAEKLLFRLMKAGFAGKRKQLLGTLVRSFPEHAERLSEAFQTLSIPPEIRPQSLSPEIWLKLAEQLR